MLFRLLFLVISYHCSKSQVGVREKPQTIISIPMQRGSWVIARLFFLCWNLPIFHLHNLLCATAAACWGTSSHRLWTQKRGRADRHEMVGIWENGGDGGVALEKETWCTRSFVWLNINYYDVGKLRPDVHIRPGKLCHLACQPWRNYHTSLLQRLGFVSKWQWSICFLHISGYSLSFYEGGSPKPSIICSCSSPLWQSLEATVTDT